MLNNHIAVIDPAAGAAGDMFLGALLECGASRDSLLSLPSRLGLAESVEIEVAAVSRASIAATKVSVRVNGRMEEPGEAHGSHHHHGPHRHVSELLARIAQGNLSEGTKKQASAIFRLLAEAEGRVHGITPENVSLHEVGAWDALIDVVGTVEGFESLKVARIFSRPPPVGNGWVSAAHGRMAVPAPATALLLEGFELAEDTPAEGEAVTPTGAALLRGLSKGSPPDRWRPVAQGWGAGTRNPAGYANALRIFLAERVPETTQLSTIAADLDDLSPEYIEPLRIELVRAGAVDVQVWPTWGKKGRVAIRVEAHCASQDLANVTDAFMVHSTTAGVRIYRAQRTVLSRRTIEVPLEGGIVRVKVVSAPNGPRFKPEFDDVTAIASRTEVPALAVAQRAKEIAREQFRAKSNEE